MKVEVFCYKTDTTETITDVKSVEAQSTDPCLVVNFNNGSWRLIDTSEAKVSVTISDNN